MRLASELSELTEVSASAPSGLCHDFRFVSGCCLQGGRFLAIETVIMSPCSRDGSRVVVVAYCVKPAASQNGTMVTTGLHRNTGCLVLMLVLVLVLVLAPLSRAALPT